MTAMLAALDVLNRRLLDAESIGQALDLACGEQPLPWVRVFTDQLRGIQEAAEVLETLVRQVPA